MKKERFSVEQIVAVVKQAELGAPVAELIRKVGISEQTFYRWKKQYVGMETDQARQMKQLQEENTLLDQMKTLLVDDDIAEDVLLHGLGWVKKTLDNAIERGLPPMIAVNKVRTELNSFRNSLKKRDYLPSFAVFRQLQNSFYKTRYARMFGGLI